MARFCGDYPQLRVVWGQVIGGEGPPQEVARANREQKERLLRKKTSDRAATV